MITHLLTLRLRNLWDVARMNRIPFFTDYIVKEWDNVIFLYSYWITIDKLKIMRAVAVQALQAELMVVERWVVHAVADAEEPVFVA